MTPSASYLWETLDGQVLLNSTTTCLPLSVLSPISSAEHIIRVKAVSVGCSSIYSNEVSISIDTVPSVIPYAGADRFVCDPDLISLEAELPIGFSGRWRSPNPQITFSDQTQPNAIISNLAEGVNSLYWEIVSEKCNAVYTDTVMLTLERQPELNDESISLDFNQAFEFNIFGNDILPFDYSFEILQDEPSLPYELSINGDLTIPSGSGFIGSTEIIYEICSNSCLELCDIATLNIKIGDVENCFVSNILTPNNDGFNDELVVPCLASGKFPNNRLIVFNQWGNEIFKANPYRNDWKGTYNGKTLAVGTYFYILDLGDGSTPLSGFLIIEQ